MRTISTAGVARRVGRLEDLRLRTEIERRHADHLGTGVEGDVAP